MIKFHLSKDKLLKKPIHILSNYKITKPMNINEYINQDIPSSKEWILACKKREHMEFIKTELNHPYMISQTNIQDLSYFIQKQECNIVLILNIYCDLVTKKVVYIIAYLVLNDLLTSGKIPVYVHKINF
jgi:hypothetical protein